jgi:MFS family permease
LNLTNLSFYSLPQFQDKYGILQPDGTKQIRASWKSGLSDGQQVGEIISLAICGLISERLGYRRTMMLALLTLIGLIFILFFSPNVKVLLAGEILRGIPWGLVTISGNNGSARLIEPKYFPDNHHRICLRGHARCPAPLPYYLCEYNLGFLT